MRESAVKVSVRSPNPRMNVLSHSENKALGLVEIVDLKWLLAGEGVHVNVDRLRSDPVYARRVLDAAEASTNPALPAVAARVRRLLGLDQA